MIRVAALDAMPADEAYRELFHCCGVRAWAKGMTEGRPYATEEALLAAAERQWQRCGRAEWLEAFSQHPKIGDLDSLRKRFKDTAQVAAGEQAGVRSASDEVLVALANGNRAYEERYEHIFIVCATGKSAEEMLANLRSRLGNDPQKELAIAASEQKKITRLRLEKIGVS